MLRIIFTLLIFPIFLFSQEIILNKNDSLLTTSEKDYLKNKDFTIYSIDWEPFLVKDENGIFSKGIAFDVWNKIASTLNVKYNSIGYPSLTSLFEDFKKDPNAILLSTSYTEKRAKFAAFSKTFVSFPIAIATNIKEPYMVDLKKLEGKTVAVGESYTTYRLLKKNFPKIKFRLVKNTQEALMLLANSQVYAAADILPVLVHHLNKNHFLNIKISGTSDFKFDVKILVNKENERLIPIINKVIDSISAKEIQEIIDKWIVRGYEIHKTDYRLFYKIVIPLIIILIFLAVLYLVQRKKNETIKKLNLEVESQKTKYENILRYSTEGIMIHCPKTGRVIEHSKAAETLLGYSKEEFKNLSVFDFDKDIKTKENLEKVVKMISYKPISFERIHTRKDGSTYNALVSVSYLTIDGNEYVYSNVKDITKRKQLEQELKDANDNLELKIKEATKKLNTSLEIVEKYVITSKTDLSGVITDVSDKFCEVSKYKKEELIGKNHNIVRHPDMPASMFRDLWKTIKSGKTWKGRVKNKDKFGNAYWVDSTVSPMYDENGKHIGYFSNRVDVTQEVLNNEMKEKYNKELEQKVHEQLEEIKQKNMKIMEQEKLASMGEMLKNISHHWRQPLSVISICSSGVKYSLEFGGLSKDEMCTQLEKVNENCQYLSKTIETFSSYVETDKSYQECSIQKEIETCKYIFDTSLKSNLITLIDEIDYSKNNMSFMVKNELSQVMINIMSNAEEALESKKFMDDKWIKISSQINEDRFILMIEDNAGGIPEDIIQKIFEPYFTTKFKSKGTGLGLSNSYSVVKNSIKGDIYVKNTENGAKFFIEVPLLV